MVVADRTQLLFRYFLPFLATNLNESERHTHIRRKTWNSVKPELYNCSHSRHQVWALRHTFASSSRSIAWSSSPTSVQLCVFSSYERRLGIKNRKPSYTKNKTTRDITCILVLHFFLGSLGVTTIIHEHTRSPRYAAVRSAKASTAGEGRARFPVSQHYSTHEVMQWLQCTHRRRLAHIQKRDSHTVWVTYRTRIPTHLLVVDMLSSLHLEMLSE